MKITMHESLDKIGFPETVYKYRCWDNPLHQSIIKQRKVYMAAPSSFEDPLDCKFPIRWDLLTNEDIYNQYFGDSINKNPEWSRQQHRKFARDWSEKSAVRQPKIVADHQKKTFRDYDEHAGILSLTANPSLMKMWEDYSCHHEGFVVGFNSRIMFDYLGGGGQVQYVDEIPIIYPSPKHNFDEQRNLQIFHKLSKWSFEEEYRTTRFGALPLTIRDRTIELPIEAYKEIIIGDKMPAHFIAEILDLISLEMSHVEVRKAKIIDDEIVIDSL